MSRGGRGGGRGGRGGSKSAFSLANMPDMGLTFADLQNMSVQETDLYPSMDSLPVLTSFTLEETRVAQLQMGFADRLRQSAYYITDIKKTDDLPRYSDKYRPSPAARPTLKRRDLHQAFFPSEIYEGYFNPKRKKKPEQKATKRINLDDLGDEVDVEEEKSNEEKSDAGSQQADSDYDVDEEYDNDYAENYFDNGEEDNFDDLGGGGGGDDIGGIDD